MRKNLIAMSVSTLVAGLGLAGGAAANVLRDNGAATISATNATSEVVTTGGIGHQLIVPYFTTRNGNSTLINIVNTDTANAKAVKVRFRGAAGSDDIYDFELFLSHGDHWSANISAGSDGRSVLTTSDNSCTLPAVVSGPFVTARLQPSLTDEQKAAGTSEGYIEIFNMADIPRFLPNADGSVSATVGPLWIATKHIGGLVPCTVATMDTLKNDPPTLAAAYALGFRAPSTGLFANWTIINVPNSGAEVGEATSIAAQLGPLPGLGNIVFFPQTGDPEPNTDIFTADPSLRTTAGVGATQVQNGSGGAYIPGGGLSLPIVGNASKFDLPDLSTPYLLTPALALTAADPIAHAESLTRSLATTNVINEYLTGGPAGLKTDWVFSMPTRRYWVATDYRPASPLRAFTVAPTHDFFTGSNTSLKTVNGNTLICTSTNGVTFYDQEEGTAQGSSFVISPNPPAASFTLCGETSVLSFNSATSSVLGSTVAQTSFNTSPFTSGWANVATPGLTTGNNGATPGVNVRGNGLPILGKQFTRASSGPTNFGAAWEHRGVRPVN